MYHKTTGYRIFNGFNLFFIAAVSLLCVLPLVHILAVSFSGKAAASANLVTLWPIDFTVDAYTKTFGNSNFLSALWISVQRTVFGTLLSMVLVTPDGISFIQGKSEFQGTFTVCVVFHLHDAVQRRTISVLYPDSKAGTNQHPVGSDFTGRCGGLEPDSHDELLP